MILVLKIVSFVLPAVAAVLASVVGASMVKEVRRKTGDDSLLTSILSGELFHR